VKQLARGGNVEGLQICSERGWRRAQAGDARGYDYIKQGGGTRMASWLRWCGSRAFEARGVSRWLAAWPTTAAWSPLVQRSIRHGVVAPAIVLWRRATYGCADGFPQRRVDAIRRRTSARQPATVSVVSTRAGKGAPRLAAAGAQRRRAAVGCWRHRGFWPRGSVAKHSLMLRSCAGRFCH
jgi:hypothetical protein